MVSAFQVADVRSCACGHALGPPGPYLLAAAVLTGRLRTFAVADTEIPLLLKPPALCTLHMLMLVSIERVPCAAYHPQASLGTGWQKA